MNGCCLGDVAAALVDGELDDAFADHGTRITDLGSDDFANGVAVDADGRILLCDTAFKSDWELPGGIVEPGEAPRDGAIREVREELGIDLPVGRLLVADWLPPYLGWDDALELIFDGGQVSDDDLASFSLQENEITSVSLLTLEQAAEVVLADARGLRDLPAGEAVPVVLFEERQGVAHRGVRPLGGRVAAPGAFQHGAQQSGGLGLGEDVAAEQHDPVVLLGPFRVG